MNGLYSPFLVKKSTPSYNIPVTKPIYRLYVLNKYIHTAKAVYQNLKNMFGNKKDEGKTKNTGLITPTSTNSLNSLVKGTVIEGTVRSESDIRIDGTIKGKLFCDAKIIIGPTGKVEGEINCGNAVIEGGFDGTIQVKDTLIVKEKAVITGDVTTAKLIVASGAIFNVNCNMGGSSKSSPGAKQQNTSATTSAKNGAKSSEKASPLG